MTFLAGLVGLFIGWLIARWLLARPAQPPRTTLEVNRERIDQEKAHASPTALTNTNVRSCPDCGLVFERHVAMVEPKCDKCVAKDFEAAEERDRDFWDAQGWKRDDTPERMWRQKPTLTLVDRHGAAIQVKPDKDGAA